MCFSQVLCLDCVHNMILQCFHQSQGSILVQTFIFSPLSALCNSGFRQTTKSEINGWFDATAVQQSKIQLKRLENDAYAFRVALKCCQIS